MKQTILFLRNNTIFESLSKAKDELNAVSHKKGQPIIATYKDGPDPGRQVTKMLFAIGIESGAGADKYKLICTMDTSDDLTAIVTALAEQVDDHLKSKGVESGHMIDSPEIDWSEEGAGVINVNSVALNKLVQAAEAGFIGQSANDSYKHMTVAETLAVLNVYTKTESDNKFSQFSFNNIKVGDKTVVSNNKLDTLELVAGPDITLSADEESKKVTISASIDNHVVHGTGDVDVSGDIHAMVTSIIPDVNLKGNPTTTTQDKEDNSNKIATTAMVQAAIEHKMAANKAMEFKGTLGTYGTVTSLPAEHEIGDTYVAIEGAPAVQGKKLEIGDTVICLLEGKEAKDTDWVVVQTNIDGAVISPNDLIDNHIVLGAGGKSVKDSGVEFSQIVQKSTNINTGEGLVGGGSLESDITISHGSKPESGEDAGGTGELVSGVVIDKFGHVSSTTKTNLTGGIAAVAGKYVSSIEVNGKNISGTTAELPKLKVIGGETEGGRYISSIAVDDHTISVSKSALPAESGKVKVDESGVADYLSNKVVSDTSEGNKYSVSVNKVEDKLKLSVTIDTIDGGTY